MNKEESEGYVKTSINNCLKKMAEQPEEFFDNYKLQEKYNKVIKENNNLKQALNQIREFIYRNREEYSHYVGSEKDWLYIKDKDILQIIDKVGGNDENNKNN